MEHAGRGIERLSLLEEAHRERDREGSEGEAASRFQSGRHPLEDRGLVAAAEQPEPALAETDDRIELGRERKRTHVELDEFDRRPVSDRGVTSEAEEVRRTVDTDHVEPSPGECEGVPA